MTLYRVCCIEYTWLFVNGQCYAVLCNFFSKCIFLAFKEFDNSKSTQHFEHVWFDSTHLFEYSFLISVCDWNLYHRTYLLDLEIKKFNMDYILITWSLGYHTYIIVPCNPLSSITAQLHLTPHALCVLILYGTYSLKLTSKDRFEKFFMAICIYSQSFSQNSAARKLTWKLWPHV